MPLIFMEVVYIKLPSVFKEKSKKFIGKEKYMWEDAGVNSEREQGQSSGSLCSFWPIILVFSFFPPFLSIAILFLTE